MNLQALLRRLSSTWRRRIWSPRIGAVAQRALERKPIAVLVRQRLSRDEKVARQDGKVEVLLVKLDLASLDLGEVKHVVDEAEEMLAGAVHALERLGEARELRAFGLLPQHLGEADDGVERRAQLVAHIGEELRLVLARNLELRGSSPRSR